VPAQERQVPGPLKRRPRGERFGEAAAFFLSDLITAGGKRLEPWVCGNRKGRPSTLVFPREYPTPNDWALWDEFWKNWLNKNTLTPIALGRWLHQSHQQWQWFLDNTSNSLWERATDGWVKYEFNQMGPNTRGNRTYRPTGLWRDLPGDFLPASVKQVTSGAVQIIDVGPPFLDSSTETVSHTFWEFVEQQGGTWMWDFIDGKHDDMSWIVTAMRNHTAIMVTDGSFHRKLAPTTSGAGWLLVCTKSLKMIRGCFYEESSKASSYRGELLGLLAIHHLAFY